MPAALKPALVAAAWALLMAGSPAAGAATVCTVSVSLLAFGLYDTLSSTPLDTSGSIQVTCVPGVSDPLTTAYTITIAGTGVSADTVRSISNGSNGSNGSNRLYYQVSSNAAHTVVWGNGSSSGPGISSSVTSAAALTPGVRVHTAHARLPAQQRVAPGAYTGSLLVTVEY